MQYLTVNKNILPHIQGTFQTMYLPKYEGGSRNSIILQCNSFSVPQCLNRHFSSSVKGSKDSSKVERTIKALKQEKEAESSLKEEENVTEVVKVRASEKEIVPKKPSIAQRIIKELKHYYHGFRLLFIDIKVAAHYSWQMLRGKSLTRRERRQVNLSMYHY